MKYKFQLIVLILCSNTILAQLSHNMELLDNFNNTNLPKVDGTDIWNDITGWVNIKDGREYAIAGSTDSIYIFLITDNHKLQLVDVEYGACRFARNRDYETYKHYLYTVSDQASGIGSLQIFDLSFLPDSVHKVYESRTFAAFTHTIFIDSNSKRLYMCGNSGSGAPQTLRILGLNNPTQPQLLSDLVVPVIGGSPIFNYVHEMYARNDTVYLSTGNTGLFVFDLTNLQNQKLLSIIKDYPFKGYNHSSWLDPTGKFLMFTDENIGLDVKIFDIGNLSEPKFVSNFNSSSQAMPHNAYWYGDFAYVSAYHDGVQVWNVKNPYMPYRVAWYETYRETPKIYSGFKGCWGVYPYLPSKRILASDLTNGIFLLSIDTNLVGVPDKKNTISAITCFPNPANHYITIISNFNDIEAEVLSLHGNLCTYKLDKVNEQTFNTKNIPEGIYILKVSAHSGNLYHKIIIRH